MLEFQTILNKGTIENIPLLLEIDHLTSEDEAKPEEGCQHALLNIHGGDHGLYNNGGVDKLIPKYPE